MSHGNLRYYGLGAMTGLTALGWVLDRISPEIKAAVFVAIGAIITADYAKHKNDNN